jgi:hypothetical protein
VNVFLFSLGDKDNTSRGSSERTQYSVMRYMFQTLHNRYMTCVLSYDAPEHYLFFRRNSVINIFGVAQPTIVCIGTHFMEMRHYMPHSVIA